MSSKVKYMEVFITITSRINILFTYNRKLSHMKSIRVALIRKLDFDIDTFINFRNSALLNYINFGARTMPRTILCAYIPYTYKTAKKSHLTVLLTKK